MVYILGMVIFKNPTVEKYVIPDFSTLDGNVPEGNRFLSLSAKFKASSKLTTLT